MSVFGPLARAGVSQSTTAPWPFADDVAAYRAGGWRSIGVWLQKLERDVMGSFWFPDATLDAGIVDAAANTVADAGLTVSHVVVAGRFTEHDNDLRHRRVDYAVHAADVACRLGAHCLVVVPGRLGDLSERVATEISVRSLCDVLERTEDAGVSLAIEPVREVDFVSTLDAALDLVDAVGHPRLGVFPDVFHLWHDPGLEEALARAAGRILGVHIADGVASDGHATRVPPGEGDLPLAPFVAAVEATGYAGTYDVELFAMGATPGEAAAMLERSVVGMSDLLAGARA